MEKQNNIEVPAKKEEALEEPPKAREELEKKKSPEQEIDEIDREISEIEELMEKEKKELAEKRAKLGLPETDEESVSMKYFAGKIKNLTAKNSFGKQRWCCQQKEAGEEEEKETKTEKIKLQEFEDFIATTKRLASFLKERDSQRLDRLIDDPERIGGAISALESSLSSKSPDTEGAGRAIYRIADIIDELGKKQTGGVLRENPDSLGRLAVLLINIDKEKHILGGRISKKENASDILPSLSKIESATQNKRTKIYQKLDLLKRSVGR